MTWALVVDKARCPIELLTALCRAAQQPLRPIEVGLRQRQLGLALIESGDSSTQKSDFVFDVLDRVLQSPAPGPGLCFDIPHRGFGRAQVRGRGIDGCSFHGNHVLKRLLVELGEKLAVVDTVVVVDQYARDLAGDPRSDEGHMAVDIGVIGRNRAERYEDPTDTE